MCMLLQLTVMHRDVQQQCMLLQMTLSHPYEVTATTTKAASADEQKKSVAISTEGWHDRLSAEGQGLFSSQAGL